MNTGWLDYMTKTGTSNDYTKIGAIAGLFGAGTADSQGHDWYFGVDEAELALNVSGTADNGLNYGFKIEIQVNTSAVPITA